MPAPIYTGAGSGAGMTEKFPFRKKEMFATRFLDIDQLAYAQALALMRGLVELKKGSAQPEILMLLEHEPVLTMGRRSQDSEILATRKCLKEQGISVHRIERGGLITYHGPGQLVIYPIFDLKQMRLGVSELVNGLETVVMNTLADFSIQADRIEGLRGVWVGKEKIASIGIAVRRGITFHGLALNYDPDFSHFEMINPCGLEGVKMTSISKITATPTNPVLLRKVLAGHLSKLFNLELHPWSLEQATALINTASKRS
jgi:lipoate-protein ligase B